MGSGVWGLGSGLGSGVGIGVWGWGLGSGVAVGVGDGLARDGEGENRRIQKTVHFLYSLSEYWFLQSRGWQRTIFPSTT